MSDPEAELFFCSFNTYLKCLCNLVSWDLLLSFILILWLVELRNYCSLQRRYIECLTDTIVEVQGQFDLAKVTLEA